MQHHPLDVSFHFRPHDRNMNVKGCEYVCQHLFEILPSLPERMSARVFVGGHPHNPEPIAMILLTDPRVDIDDWDLFAVLEDVQVWIDRQDPLLLRQLVESTEAPSYATLIEAYQAALRA
jgi:hypothetical protein